MARPSPWCLTYRYPMPREATRPAPKPEASPARRLLGFRMPERGDRPR